MSYLYYYEEIECLEISRIVPSTYLKIDASDNVKLSTLTLHVYRLMHLILLENSNLIIFSTVSHCGELNFHTLLPPSE
jgi:hypothetical protein